MLYLEVQNSLYEEARDSLAIFVELEKSPEWSVDMIRVGLAGQELMLLSAGPLFKFTPTASFLIACSSVAEVEGLWQKLIEDGAALMPMDA